MEKPTFIEHVLAATVSDDTSDEVVEQLTEKVRTALELPGVLATHTGRCSPVLGDHTFLLHIRAVDAASCDAAYQVAYEVYMSHLVETKHVEDLQDFIICDMEAQPNGSYKSRWPAIRIAIMKFKEGTPRERMLKLEEVMTNLPSKFPLVKQITWGKNVARQRVHRPNYGYADLDYHVIAILAFNSCQDMDELGADPAYWELLNFHGISTLEKYQVLTLCLG